MLPKSHAYCDISTTLGRMPASSNARQLLEDARAGDVDAMRQLGKNLIEGTVMKRDVKNGVLWIKKAVEAGDDRSMVLLGDLYTQGRGVAKSEKKAVELYMMAAEAGNKNAVKRLEKLPLKSTVSWWEARAKDGDKKAVLKLLRAYATGKGLPKDMEKARVYYEIAVREWPEDAEKVLNKLSEEQRLALVPPPPAPKPEPVAQISKTSTHGWKYVHCDSKYYGAGTQAELERCYYECLTETNSGLAHIPELMNNKFGGHPEQYAVAWYVLGEWARLTLMSKYHVTEAQLNSKYGHLIYEQKELLQQIANKMGENNKVDRVIAKRYLTYKYAIAILCEGNDVSEDFYKEALGYYFYVYLSSVDAFLGGIELFSGSIDIEVLEKMGISWRRFKCLGRYVEMTHPLWSDIIQPSYYGDIYKEMLQRRERIKQADYYGSTVIKQNIVEIFGE